MLDAYTSDGKYAFQFDNLTDVADNLEDYDLPEDVDLNEFGGPHDGALVILEQSERGGWLYKTIISADDLRNALAQSNLLPD